MYALIGVLFVEGFVQLLILGIVLSGVTHVRIQKVNVAWAVEAGLAAAAAAALALTLHPHRIFVAAATGVGVRAAACLVFAAARQITRRARLRR